MKTQALLLCLIHCHDSPTTSEIVKAEESHEQSSKVALNHKNEHHGKAVWALNDKKKLFKQSGCLHHKFPYSTVLFLHFAVSRFVLILLSEMFLPFHHLWTFLCFKCVRKKKIRKETFFFIWAFNIVEQKNWRRS